MKDALAGRGKPVLYLDFDGVLHPEMVIRTRRHGPVLSGYPGHALFENLEPLACALDAYPNLSIVLSTTWVQVYRYSHTRALVGRLAPRVVGATFHTDMDRVLFGQMSRGCQIEADAGRRQPSSWLALDDDDEDWPGALRDNLVHTDKRWGIAYPSVWEQFHCKLALLE